MTARALYNEIDPVAAHVLRAMIADGHIAPGDVCERSIKDLKADDLRGYNQVHLFAGGGFWSVSARLAGWRDDKPLWTASCPCQPFSQAGKGAGTDDPRHLWPDVGRLVREALADGQHVPVIVGEQVGGSAGYDWFNGVCTDLESEGYKTFVADTPACAVDAPHIRQRLYWVAVADTRHLDGRSRPRKPGDRQKPANLYGVKLDDTIKSGLEGQPWHGDGEAGRAIKDRPVAAPDGSGEALGDTNRTRELQRGERSEGLQFTSGRRDMHADGRDGRQETSIGREIERAPAQWNNARRNGSFWSDHEWIICHDGKARRAKPRLRNVVDGVPGRSGEDNVEGGGLVQSATDYSLIVPSFKGRVSAWKITGNAIVPVLAAQVLGALLDAMQTEGAES